MKKLFIRIISILIIVTVTGCSSSQPLILSPEIQSNNTNNIRYIGKSSTLVVNDIRPDKSIIAVMNNGKITKKIASQLPLSSIIHQNLSTEYTQQGLKIQSIAEQKINIDIEQATIHVQQGLFNYTSNRNIVLKVTMSKNANSISKTYSLKGTNEGPLKADLAVLGRDFNHGLGKLLTQIINDPELQQAIK